MESDRVRAVLQSNLPDVDESTLEYFESMLLDMGAIDKEVITETLAPFIESYGLASDLEEAEKMCRTICNELKTNAGMQEQDSGTDKDAPQLLEKAIVMADLKNTDLTEAEKATIDTLWGFDKVRNKRNTLMETSAIGSQKLERKETREAKKFLAELDSQLQVGDTADENNDISSMMMPDLSGNNRERDIHVHNFSITFGGSQLLENAQLRLAYGRRYGLIGKNGVGKTTLLRHMASFDIEGFPRHHRVLHVKQEVNATSDKVLHVVLAADVERAALLRKQKELQEMQNSLSVSATTAEIQQLMHTLQEVSERLDVIGAASAESRAASILSGLQFSDEMQQGTTASLSGGWRMRVALAAALFIEPDLLMLDEPTNHLDLQAVIWLENYLKEYPHTVLVVSHDRAFLDTVCTDIILFKKQQLTYYKGNYEQFEVTKRDMEAMQQKQHEAQAVKLNHMQDFVDKFRFNAKRAALVQSRIKAIERETVIEEVDKEEVFGFRFPDAGRLGIPIIQIESVTFGYKSNVPPLFKDVELNVDQDSRIALVGPNGAGKSTLLNLLQNKLEPQTGMIRVNPNLRLGVFTQHHMDSFDLRLSAVENMSLRWPTHHEADFRSHLGRFEIHGNDAVKPMKFTSGGQKSRIAFAVLTYSKPHVVVLDEPTNHLDMGMVEALADSLKHFNGGVLVVSHDQHFITAVCNELWVIKSGKVEVFDGSFVEYKNRVLAGIRKQMQHQQQRQQNRPSATR